MLLPRMQCIIVLHRFYIRRAPNSAISVLSSRPPVNRDDWSQALSVMFLSMSRQLQFCPHHTQTEARRHCSPTMEESTTADRHSNKLPQL